MTTERDAYLQFASGYLWGLLTDIRREPYLPVAVTERLSEAYQFIRPILAKLYEAGNEPAPNRFIFFTNVELQNLLSSLYSNDKIWRTLIQNELANRDQPSQSQIAQDIKSAIRVASTHEEI